MPLPSNVPRYDSVELLDLDQVEYVIARRPTAATLRAWGKLEETERRWTMFDWATYVIHQPNRCTRLFNDLASAYLLSFEATLQVLDDQLQLRPNLEDWLKTQPAYDLGCRGLRTLRHLEAHVRPGALSTQRDIVAYSRFAGTISGGTTPWHWPALIEGDLKSLKSAKIEAAELPEWNALATDMLALGLMRHGLVALNALVLAADP